MSVSIIELERWSILSASELRWRLYSTDCRSFTIRGSCQYFATSENSEGDQRGTNETLKRWSVAPSIIFVFFFPEGKFIVVVPPDLECSRCGRRPHSIATQLMTCSISGNFPSASPASLVDSTRNLLRPQNTPWKLSQNSIDYFQKKNC